MPLRILSAADVVRALPMGEAIEAMKHAYLRLSKAEAVMPLRSRLEAPTGAGLTLLMPAYLPNTPTGDSLAVKIVSVYPGNPTRGLPTIHAAVVALEPDTGRPLAVMDGGSLTAIRTGAASGAATDVLARRDARSAAVFGAGVQARTQLEAVCTARTIRRAWVFDTSKGKAERFASEMAGRGPIPADLRAAPSPREAVADADIICTATTSSTPVFDGRDLRAGAHVNGVGSFTLQMQEVDAETVRRALVVVDSREAAGAEAGDIVIPMRRGLVPEDHVHAELGEIIAGTKPGRTSDDQITFFKSVGVAVQDAAAARVALANAERMGLGTVVEF